ncbi:hypothetical protein JCM16163A_15690 [Paenibacillus sp. YK5]|nr:hypothetical protein PN4B1_39470 [Paenibacillus naphthalenovorans]
MATRGNLPHSLPALQSFKRKGMDIIKDSKGTAPPSKIDIGAVPSPLV